MTDKPTWDEVGPELLCAAKMLLSDVRDYPAWQRPCYATDVVESALARAEQIGKE